MEMTFSLRHHRPFFFFILPGECDTWVMVPLCIALTRIEEHRKKEQEFSVLIYSIYRTNTHTHTEYSTRTIDRFVHLLAQHFNPNQEVTNKKK
jgi:hypothetical protein